MDARSTEAAEEPSGWQRIAYERSSTRVREKARAKSDRLLRAAYELLREVGTGFTVQDLLDRSGESVRAFYQYFESKDGLFAAMFEDALAYGLRLQLRAADAAGRDPVQRLRAFVMARWEQLNREDENLARAMILFHHQLAEQDPERLAAVLKPNHEALRDLVGACRAAGRLTGALSDEVCATFIQQSLLTVTTSQILHTQYGNEMIEADQFWSLLADGMIAGPKAKARGGRAPAGRRTAS